jgi:hypothetical protein
VTDGAIRHPGDGLLLLVRTGTVKPLHEPLIGTRIGVERQYGVSTAML